MSQRLGDLLVKEKVITQEQLEAALKTQKETNARLGSVLVKLGYMSDDDVTNFLSRQYGVPAINLSYFEVDAAVVKLIPQETAKRYQILPLSRVGASLTIAMVDPTNVFAMDDIKFMTGFNIEPVVASESAILEGIEKAYGSSQEEDMEKVMQSVAEMGEADVELQAEEEQMALSELEKSADEAPIVKLGFVDDESITTFLSRQYGVPSINLAFFEVDPEVVRLVPEDTARRYEIVPLSRVGASLTIAMVDPTNVFAMDDIKFMTGFNIEPVVASESSIREALEKIYAQAQGDVLSKAMEELSEGEEVLELEAEEAELAAGELEKAAGEAPVVKLVNIILREAVSRGASDIHMEPYEKEYRVRFRIDGILQNVMNPPLKMRDAIISRLKIMSKLDIA